MGWYGSADACASGSSRFEESKRIDAVAVRAELERVLADPLFSNSKRCTSLLTYIVEKTLDGAEELKERNIGTEVFGRAADYDTSQDPPVRIATAEIRKRLILYYNEAGAEQELRIVLPFHSYVAEFSFPEEKSVLLSVLPA